VQHATFAHKIALALAIAIVVPAGVHAQNQSHESHPRYRLVDLGTLGGQVSYESADGPGGSNPQ
jgi:hypothetical protein